MTESEDTPIAADLESRVSEVLAMDPCAEALAFEGDGWSWAFISDVRDQIEAVLGAQGIDEGAAIGLALRNRPGSFAALIAIVISKRCVVTLSPLFSDSALIEDIVTLKLDAIIAYDEEWSRGGLRRAAESTPSALIRISDDRAEPIRLLRESRSLRFEPRLPDIAIEMLSSGTTGKPKRIPLALDRFTSALRAGGTTWDRHGLATGHTLMWTPLVHISGMYFVFDTICSARATVLFQRFDVTDWVNAVEMYELRVAGLSPAAMKMVLDSDVDPSRIRSLRVVRSGTAPLNPDLQEAFEHRFRVPVFTTYGATEFAGAVAGWSMSDYQAYGEAKRGSAGRAFPGIQLRTMNSNTGLVNKPGEEGVLEISGGQTTHVGEWLRTTDLAIIDEDGFLWIRGRTDDVIIRGGFKVHPSKIVRVLEEHPAVREAEATGLADVRLGEVPIAGVVLASEHSVGAAELFDWCAERLAKYEVPTDIVIVEDLPRTPSLKVDRPALRALVAMSRGS